MVKTYNDWLVGLSFLIAVLTSYAGIDLSLRARGSASWTNRYHWGFISAFSIGIGIWVMHFIGMLALELPIAVSYNIPVTIVSQIAAVSGSWLALTIVSGNDPPGARRLWRALVGGICMATGIVSMHYLGLSAIDIKPAISYDGRYVALSVGVAVAAAVVAMFVIRHLQTSEGRVTAGKKILGAMVLAASIVAMHYSGMHSAHLAVGSYCTTSPLSFGHAGMAVTVCIFSLLLIAIVIFMSVLNGDGHSSRFGLTLISVASILPMSLLLMLYLFLDFQNDSEKAVAHAISQAHSLANAVDGELGGIAMGLNALATSPYLERREFAAFRRQAEKSLAGMDVTNLFLVDSAGRQLMNTERASGEALPRLPDTAFADQVFSRQRTAISDLMTGPLQQNKLVIVMVPVKAGDKVAYALGASIDSGRLSALLARQALPADRVIAIYDNAGRFIARNWDIERWLGQPGSPSMLRRIRAAAEGSVEVRTVDGVTVVGVFARSGLSGWAVAIGIPKKSLMADLWSSIWMLVGYALFFLAISLSMAWLLGSRIVESIHSLIHPARALGRQQSVKVPTLYLKELEKVGRALEEASLLLHKTSHEANHDLLTGLPNRSLFAQVVKQHLSLCARNESALAILFIDLDGFKGINDTHGHAIGDNLLKAVATRIQVCLRKADLAARLGGDEFAALLVNVDRNGAALVAQKLVESLSAPYAVGPHLLKISASIGVTLSEGNPEDSIDTLLNRSDEAMYQAKTAGKKQYVITPP